MLTLICAGGSGARILEAVIHLCAAGLGPPKLRTFVLDSDANNGNLDNANKLVQRYSDCQMAFGSDQFFKTELDLMQAGTELRTWVPVDRAQKFDAVLDYCHLKPLQQDVVHLFFTDDELNMSMEKGFMGHPALGAAAFSLLSLYRENPEDTFWKQLEQSLIQEVQTGESRVVIAGSVFGGTGAAAIHPLVRYLRESLDRKQNADRLRVGAVALVPYFRFSAVSEGANGQPPASELAAKSEHFQVAAKLAAHYYEHLRKTDDWEFDAMYWIGDDDPVRVEYAEGGPQQNNNAHFVDLLGALACLDFSKDTNPTGTCCYGGPLEVTNEDPAAGKNVVTWEDLPMRAMTETYVRTQLHTFHLAAAAHLGFFDVLFQDPRLETKAHCLPWYFERFPAGAGSLSSRESKKQLDSLRLYLSHNYFPWWSQIHSLNAKRVRLLNTAAWNQKRGEELQIEINRLDNLLYPDRNEHTYDCVDRFFEQTLAVAPITRDDGSPPRRYFSILTAAAKQLVADLEAGQAGKAGQGEAAHG